jgi:hypothetical protein
MPFNNSIDNANTYLISTLKISSQYALCLVFTMLADVSIDSSLYSTNKNWNIIFGKYGVTPAMSYQITASDVAK